MEELPKPWKRLPSGGVAGLSDTGFRPRRIPVWSANAGDGDASHSPVPPVVLRILRGQHPDPASTKLVAQRMIDKSSNVSRLVEKLRTKGLVTRTACDQDRRAVDLTITRDGLDLLGRIDDDVEIQPSNIVEQMTAEEVRTLNDLLDRVRG